MRHTFPVHGKLQIVAVVGALALTAAPCIIKAQTFQASVDAAAVHSPEARIVVLDVASGRLIAAHRLKDAARTLAAPGSTLKPLILYQLVAAGQWDPATRIACNRRLVVAGHRLACTHPPAPPLDAREALTWSCNTYFAAVARTLRPGELGRLLQPTGLLGASGLAPEEAIAELREPESADDEQLTLLGVEGIHVTPLELAVAYRWLARELTAHPTFDAARVVGTGLRDSASFGMAGEASLGGVSVMGKTGTAESAASSQSHGWFVGIAPAQNPTVIIAVYLPAGRGADAAHVAGEVLAHAHPGQP